MKIIRLLCIVVCVHTLASCIVTGKQKVVLRFKDRQTLKPVAGMRVRLEWSDERPWRFAIPNTLEGLTDSRGVVAFERLSEQYWRIKAYRTGRQVGTLGFWLDVTQGVDFDCGPAQNKIESNRLLMDRDRNSPVGPAPGMVMTAREIRPNGTERNAENYEHIKLRDD